MSNELEPGRGINPSEQAGLTPEEKFQQTIEKHFEGHDLQSPRVQASFDFIDLRNVDIRQPWQSPIETASFDENLIMETIRQRINGVQGYKKEIELFANIAKNFEEELKDRDMLGEARTKYSQELVDTKNKTIDRLSQQSQTPPQQ
jgi:hypothetical protein